MDLWIWLEIQCKKSGVRVFWVNTLSKIYHPNFPMKINFQSKKCSIDSSKLLWIAPDSHYYITYYKVVTTMLCWTLETALWWDLCYAGLLGSWQFARHHVKFGVYAFICSLPQRAGMSGFSTMSLPCSPDRSISSVTAGWTCRTVQFFTFSMIQEAPARHSALKHKMVCSVRMRITWGPSEDSDQPAHSRSLIRIFTGRT